MEKVGRKGEGDRKIENGETERESSHPHTVRGSKYQALCWHLSAANARQSVRETGQTDRQTLPLLRHTSSPIGLPTRRPVVQSLLISIQVRSGLCAPMTGGPRLEDGRRQLPKPACYIMWQRGRGGANNVMTEREEEKGPGYFGAQNAAIIVLFC